MGHREVAQQVAAELDRYAKALTDNPSSARAMRSGVEAVYKAALGQGVSSDEIRAARRTSTDTGIE